MSWLVAVGCIFITVIVVYWVNKANGSRLPSPRNSRQLTDTPPIRWRDIPTSNRSTPTPDPSSIVWQDLPPELSAFPTQELIFRQSTNNNTAFLDTDHNPTIQELLKSVIGSRDLLTQAEFRPRQQVYFCSNCTLAHRQDSWQESGNRCNQCGSSEHTRLYTLPDND
ncbi:MAG: hypothetical protein IM504_01430 [Microcystis sp. M038S2]|jgi:hypothetical protein|uniref:Uncharacterized protein n=1 Tax=Microcystis aeruginosa G11-04 TaxID=2685956 RepID=A0A966L4Q4_MICAE|nr:MULTISPECIES: hypothetical protein [unclassified Microcystis]NCR12020.1 hypothetical protein [Microcystis aeruginosa SX13-11]NCR15897.1 hypothetical protein [Microcystis aeruginosa LL13-03]NCR65288.1 hypothetical protein [Microcystis aeruginosa LL11-07]NCS00656.1 hypothetical protein [Microcystis aeruginosa G13-11]NCS05315.1 hypothetical protein [Microcystis aeruginosa G13-07]NCS18934.1 hypothetical protein [Microcystis aeruginosa G11-06]NCS57020.1 hypothetical protein [Microcystis aerugi